MSNAILVENGIPRGAIHLDAAANDVHRFVAEEIRRYVELLSGGRLPIVTEPAAGPGGGLILVGGPRANDTVRRLVERGAVDPGRLTADGAYLLKSVDLDGRGCVVVAGRDDTGTMHAAYELLERLGAVFQLTGDIIPERKATLELPELDVAAAPARKFRGVHVWHAYTWNMGMQDYRRLIDQIAKMKMNVLEFYWGMGAPWVEVFHDGVRGELTTTPESGYLAVGRDSRSWGRSVHTTTGTRSEVRVGRECFPHERAVRGGVPGGRLRGRGVCRRDPVPARDHPLRPPAVRAGLAGLRRVAVRVAQPGPSERQGRPRRGAEREPQLPALLRGGGADRRSGGAGHLGGRAVRGDRDLSGSRLLRGLGARAQPGLRRRRGDPSAAERGHGDPGAHAVARGDPRGRQLHPRYRQGPGVRRHADAPGVRADRPGETATRGWASRCCFAAT